MSKKLVDFHTHILPGLDHGSRSADEMAEQISLFEKYGIEEVVCTSHFYGHLHKIDDFLSKREKSFSELQQYLAQGNIKLRAHLGAEILAFAGIENLERLSELAIGNSKVLLIELPYAPLTNDIEMSIVKLMRKGYQILLAHADRYDEIDIEKMISHGAKIQLNASALNKFFVKKAYMRWIGDGVCVAIGSDIHGADEKAMKKFMKASKKSAKYHDAFHQYADTVLK